MLASSKVGTQRMASSISRLVMQAVRRSIPKAGRTVPSQPDKPVSWCRRLRY
jgi:hypothetical protein